MKSTSLTVMLSIVLGVLAPTRLTAQTAIVTLRNENESGSNIGGTLSVYDATGQTVLFANRLSGSNVTLSTGMEYQFRTDQQFLAGYQHHDWNSVANEYLLKHNEPINNNTTERAIFKTYNTVTFSLDCNVPNAPEVSEWLKFKDPWWIENTSTNYQPDDFRTFNEMGISGSHGIFWNQGVQTGYPYYSIKAPALIAGTGGIYAFQGWTITGASSQPDPAHPGELRYRGLVFNSSSVSITANYTQVNNQANTYTIPEDDEMVIPAGANITLRGDPNQGFKLNVEGSLLNEGDAVLSSSNSDYWDGISAGYNATIILDGVTIKDARKAIDLGTNWGNLETDNSQIYVKHSVFENVVDGVYHITQYSLCPGDGIVNLNVENCTFVNAVHSINIDAYLDLCSLPGHLGDGGIFAMIRNNIYYYSDFISLAADPYYSLFFNFTYNTYNLDPSNITGQDPLFVTSPPDGDYHLQSGSPCIDAGDPASPLDPDYTVADIGAYYFDAVPSTPTGFHGTGSQGQNPTLYWDPVAEPDIDHLELKRTVTG